MKKLLFLFSLLISIGFTAAAQPPKPPLPAHHPPLPPLPPLPPRPPLPRHRAHPVYKHHPKHKHFKKAKRHHAVLFNYRVEGQVLAIYELKLVA